MIENTGGWRKRFAAGQMGRLSDKPPPGASHKIGDEIAEW
jgi:hypothetical protein